MRLLILSWMTAVAVLPLSHALAQTTTFRGLGTLPGLATSQGWALSADGSAAGGISAFGGPIDYAWRWTGSGGMQGLGSLSGSSDAFAHDLSGDGSVIVGYAVADNSDTMPFRWTAATGMVALGHLGNATRGGATGIADDGSVIVGSSGGIPFRWTAQTGMSALPLPPNSPGGGPRSLSGNGVVAVGSASYELTGRPTKWVGTSAVVPLNPLPGAVDASGIANAASYDGSVIVGAGRSPRGLSEAIRWTADGVAHPLGDLPGGMFDSLASGVSADGNVVVGVGNSINGYEPFVWDPVHGMRALRAVLVNLGMDMTGWRLNNATAVSADGTTIVGTGENPAGRQEAYLATIPAVPEPALAAPLLVAGAALRRRRRCPVKTS